jgi:hypothetical protein
VPPAPPDDDEDVAPIVVPTPDFGPRATFGLARERRSSIRGSRYFFSFYLSGDLVLRAKAKGRFPAAPVAITAQQEVHLRGGSEYQLVPQQGCSTFSLRRADAELARIVISNRSPLLMTPAHTTVQLFDEIGCPAIGLVSRRPKMSIQGKWELDFGRRFLVRSQKNAVFVQQGPANDAELVAVRKIGTNSFEVDMVQNIPPIAGFAVALSLCLAKFD